MVSSVAQNLLLWRAMFFKLITELEAILVLNRADTMMFILALFDSSNFFEHITTKCCQDSLNEMTGVERSTSPEGAKLHKELQRHKEAK